MLLIEQIRFDALADYYIYRDITSVWRSISQTHGFSTHTDDDRMRHDDGACDHCSRSAGRGGYIDRLNHVDALLQYSEVLISSG